MSQLRKDPIIGRWVIISTERGKRPHDFVVQKDPEVLPEKQCLFCQGQEADTPAEIYAARESNTLANASGWYVRVLPNIDPLMQSSGDIGRRGMGMFDLMNAIGAHELIVETPKHIANIADLDIAQINQVFKVYVQRTRELEKDPRIKYVLISKNYGIAAGASPIKHSRTQLIALPVNPKRVKEELAGARRYYEFRERCIFCDMIEHEIEKQVRIVDRMDGFIAFCPYASRFPFEVWVLPEDHSADFFNLKNTEGLAKIMKSVTRKLSVSLQDPPYNYIIHTAPFRRMTSPEYWKTIDYDYHWHIEIMPRLTKVAGFELGSGFYINPTPPEAAAEFLNQQQGEKQ
ncbi:MAG: galactose-1-phosphate uridylyltransferase [Candidatus Omnitrophica bacterium]|nr:galactose-1-phosphate uridylyltransferase [Candidatus Omnitrophota bacterium]